MKAEFFFNKIPILINLTLVSIILTLFLGCSSDEQDEELVYPSNLILSGYEVTSDVKVFTIGGEITDSKVISKFLKTYIHDVSSEPFELKKGFVELKESGDTINFNSKDFAFFNDYNSRIVKAYGNRVPKQVEDQIYFYPKDTLLSQFNFFAGDFENIILQMGNYKPYFKNISPSSASQNSQFSLYKSYMAFIAKGNTSKLEFPYLNYYISRKTITHSSWTSARFIINNTLDKNVVKLLQVGDTLAIQEVNKIYKKY